MLDFIKALGSSSPLATVDSNTVTVSKTISTRVLGTRPLTAVVVANLGERVYVSPQVRDPALGPSPPPLLTLEGRRKVSRGNFSANFRVAQEGQI